MKHKSLSFTILLALAACSSPGPARSQQAIIESSQPGAGFFEFQGHRTFYIERGARTAPPLVLIHGFGSSTYTWRHLLEPLAREYRVLAVDLIGFGLSDKPDIRYDMALFSAQVLALMDHLGIQSAAFAGNSMGGRITLFTAGQAPERVRSMVLIDAAAYPTGGDRPLLLSLARTPCLGEFLALFNSRSRVRAMLHDVYYDDALVTEVDVETYYFPLQTSGGSRAALSLLRQDDFGGDVAAFIPNLKIPALVLWGANDPWIPLANGERMHAELPQSTLEVYPNTGHVPQEERPAAVLESMQVFLRKHS